MRIQAEKSRQFDLNSIRLYNHDAIFSLLTSFSLPPSLPLSLSINQSINVPLSLSLSLSLSLIFYYRFSFSLCSYFYCPLRVKSSSRCRPFRPTSGRLKCNCGVCFPAQWPGGRTLAEDCQNLHQMNQSPLKKSYKSRNNQASISPHRRAGGWGGGEGGYKKNQDITGE